MHGETISEYFKQKRILAGISQQEVADVLGYTSPQLVSNWERGLCSPPLNKLRALIDLYKLNPRKVMVILMAEQKKILEENLNLTVKKRKKTKLRA